MLVVTTDTVAGQEIDEVLGLVAANSVRARNVGRDILAGVKSLLGGEIFAYKKLMRETREQVLAELVEQAEQMGADAVVAVRMGSADISQQVAEIYMYGTAVKLK